MEVEPLQKEISAEIRADSTIVSNCEDTRYAGDWNRCFYFPKYDQNWPQVIKETCLGAAWWTKRYPY